MQHAPPQLSTRIKIKMEDIGDDYNHVINVIEDVLRTRRIWVPDGVARDHNAMQAGAVYKGGMSKGKAGKAKGKGTKGNCEKGGKSCWEKGWGKGPQTSCKSYKGGKGQLSGKGKGKSYAQDQDKKPERPCFVCGSLGHLEKVRVQCRAHEISNMFVVGSSIVFSQCTLHRQHPIYGWSDAIMLPTQGPEHGIRPM